MADLAFAGLLDFHKEKLDGQEFLDVSQVLQKALANESRAKEALQKSNGKPNRHVYVLSCESNCSEDGGKDVMLLNLLGLLMINLAVAVLSSRFKKSAR